jgi:hypothetical protein
MKSALFWILVGLAAFGFLSSRVPSSLPEPVPTPDPQVIIAKAEAVSATENRLAAEANRDAAIAESNAAIEKAKSDAVVQTTEQLTDVAPMLFLFLIVIILIGFLGYGFVKLLGGG